MKRLIMLLEVEDSDQQQFVYDVLQQMVEDRQLEGYFTLVDNGEAVEDLPDYMEYERNKLIPLIANLEKNFDNLYHK
jgi:hypothetical protein